MNVPDISTLNCAELNQLRAAPDERSSRSPVNGSPAVKPFVRTERTFMIC